jgi:hypothetical protein
MSALYDWLADYTSETYDETVDFWTSGHAIDDIIDTAKFTVENPKLMAETAKEQFVENVHEIEAASKKDFTKLAIMGAICLVIYYQFFVKRGK